MSIRVLLVDENTLFRLGLCALIAAHADLAVVGHVSTGREAFTALLDKTPNVVLMDVVRADMGELQSVTHLKRRQPSVKVVMLTSFRNEEFVREALRAGADGYVLKDASFDELLIALRSVANGNNYLSPEISTHVVQRFLHPQSQGANSSPLEKLTARERSVLQLIAQGRTNRSAAEFLSLSPKTVEKHRASMMHKLGLRNASELTLVALEFGLIASPFATVRMTKDWAQGDYAL